MIDLFSIGSDIFYSETEALSLYLRGKDSSIFDEFDPAVSDIKGYLCLLKLLSYCGLEDTKYFVGNAQALKKLEMIENSLRDNSKIVITEHGISPTLLLGSLPVSVTSEKSDK